MNTEYYESIFDDFKKRHPYMLDDVLDYNPRGEMGIRIKLANGDSYDYDIMTRGLRKTKFFSIEDISEVTEERCRSVLAHNLSERMALKGYSQQNLAEHTGLSKGTIYNYIHGTSTASAIALRKLAMALNCTIDELLS